MCCHKHSETTFWEEILTEHGHRFWKESYDDHNHTKVLLWPGFFYYNLHLIWLHGLQEQERRAGYNTACERLQISTCTQATARTELRTEHSKLWNASYKGKKFTTTTTTTKLLRVKESAESVCVCLCTSAFRLKLQDNCKYVELSIWTPKRIKNLKSQMASHYARIQHLLSDQGWCSMNRENQLLVSDEPVEVQDFRKITNINMHTSKSKDGTWNETFKVVECKL